MQLLHEADEEPEEGGELQEGNRVREQSVRNREERAGKRGDPDLAGAAEPGEAGGGGRATGAGEEVGGEGAAAVQTVLRLGRGRDAEANREDLRAGRGPAGGTGAGEAGHLESAPLQVSFLYLAYQLRPGVRLHRS